MPNNSETKRFMISSLTIVALAVIAFLFWYINKFNTHAIEVTQKCGEIYTLKAPGYFGTSGANRYIYGKKLNTCIMLNIANDPNEGTYRLTAIDIITDQILLFYDLKSGETIDSVLGLTREEAIEKARELGFVIIS